MTWRRASGLLLNDYHPIYLVLLALIPHLIGSTRQHNSLTQSETAEPKGGIVFTSDRSGNWDLFLIQPNGSGLTQLKDSPTVDADPDWSPDRRLIAFRSRRDGSSDIFIIGSDGSAPMNLINDPESSIDDEFAPRWNPDGETFSIYTDRFAPRGNCISGYHQIALLRKQRVNTWWTFLILLPVSSIPPPGRRMSDTLSLIQFAVSRASSCTYTILKLVKPEN